MSSTSIALIELAALAAGAVTSMVITKRVRRTGDRKVILMASVTAWTILFGLLPFYIFAVMVRRVGRAGPIEPFAALVLNALPFSLMAAPLIGLALALGSKSHRS